MEKDPAELYQNEYARVLNCWHTHIMSREETQSRINQLNDLAIKLGLEWRGEKLNYREPTGVKPYPNDLFDAGVNAGTTPDDDYEESYVSSYDDDVGNSY